MGQALNKSNTPLLEVNELKKFFPIRGSLGVFSKTREQVKAVNNVSLAVNEGETYGLVGESGCGKSTTGRTILRLTDPTSGEAIYKGKDIFQLSGKELLQMRKDIQMVFQDPYSSLNPRKRIGSALEEPLRIHSIGNKKNHVEMVMDILLRVGLQYEHYYRYPHELSGGQRQRIGIARALIVNPKILICDEPVSALDVSVQSQIINLLNDLQKTLDLTLIFIAHDISVVRYISDRIGVMYLGHIVEESDTDSLFENPLHPYTQALLSAIPTTNPKNKRERIIIEGELPSPISPPSGCVFHTRCPFAMEKCKTVMPERKIVNDKQSVVCHLYN